MCKSVSIFGHRKGPREIVMPRAKKVASKGKTAAPRKAARTTKTVAPLKAVRAKKTVVQPKAARARKTVLPPKAARAKKAVAPTTVTLEHLAAERADSHDLATKQDAIDQAKFETHPAEAAQGQNQDAGPTKAVALMLRAMHWAYDTVNHGGLGFDSAPDMAGKYRARAKSEDGAIDSLIRWHVTYAGTAGFVTGVGGLITLPVAIPADLASVLSLQLRMIAAIAHIRGYETTDPDVQTLAFICLAGNSGTEILKEFSIKIGTKFTQRGIAQISGTTLIRINQAVGFRLVTKAGTTGLINLSKWVPVLGGFIGGGFDATLTRGIGVMAKKTFKPFDSHLDTSEA
jgi:hypothetical protein